MRVDPVNPCQQPPLLIEHELYDEDGYRKKPEDSSGSGWVGIKVEDVLW